MLFGLSVQWNTCFTCLILFVLLDICDRLCSQINDDDDDDLPSSFVLTTFDVTT